MSQDASIAFTMGAFPEGTCFESEQARANAIARNMTGTLPGNFSSFNYGDTEPTEDNRDKPWIKLNGRTFVYLDGAWVREHPTPPGPNGIVVMFEGAESLIETYDGGEVGDIGDASGPMWEKITAFEAKMPVGVGTLPSTATITLGGTGGEEKVTLTEAQLPEHTHEVNLAPTEANAGNRQQNVAARKQVADTYAVVDVTTSLVTGENQAHNNMPPYIGIHFIRRTARIYYKA